MRLRVEEARRKEPSFPPSLPSCPSNLSFDNTPSVCSTRLHALVIRERDKVRGASIGGRWEGVGGSMPVAEAASAHTFPSFPRAVGFGAGALCFRFPPRTWWNAHQLHQPYLSLRPSRLEIP